MLTVHPQVGNGKLTLSEQRAHFALWALLKAPLLIGTDLRNASAGEKSCCHSAVSKELIKALQRRLSTNLIRQESFDTTKTHRLATRSEKHLAFRFLCSSDRVHGMLCRRQVDTAGGGGQVHSDLMLTILCGADVKAILLAEEVIAINQDPLGVAGDLIWKQGPNEVRRALPSPR